MKALTICQPYAELIARGEKPIENRTWPTRYRGPIAIHASKSRSWMEPEDDEQYPGMAFGAVVAVADLVACLHLGDPPGFRWPERWERLARHEHTNGPWCFVLENVRRIEPVPCRGAQGFWEWESPESADAVDPHAGSTGKPTTRVTS
jgi:hypothetical protein